jgi:hypothetical protein
MIMGGQNQNQFMWIIHHAERKSRIGIKLEKRVNVKREGKKTPYHSSFIHIMIDSSIILSLMGGVSAALVIARMC